MQERQSPFSSTVVMGTDCDDIKINPKPLQTNSKGFVLETVKDPQGVSQYTLLHFHTQGAR